MSRRIVLSGLCILIGYSILVIFALSLRFGFAFPMEVYWLSFVFVSIPVVCEAVLWNNNPKLRLLYLLSFSVMIHLQYAVVDFSTVLFSSDAVADYRLTEKIIADSRWDPFEQVSWVIGTEYRFYPITNFLYLATSLLTGIPLLLVVKYLFVIKAFVITPLINKWFRIFFDQRVAYLATMFFLSSPGAILFPHKESFAMIFFVLGIYASARIMKTREYLAIGLISMLTLIMTHHLTTYVFLGILTSICLVGYVFKRQKAVKVSIQFLMLCWIVFMAWAAFIAWAIILSHQRLLLNVFLETLLPGQLTFLELMPLHAPYERIIINIGYGITVVSAGLGFISYIRNKKSRYSGFLAISLFLLAILAVASIFRFSDSPLNILISHRAYEFGYFGAGALSAFFFIKTIRSIKKFTLDVILVCAIIVIILVGPIAGGMHPRSFARVRKTVSLGSLSVNVWMNESGASEEYTIGDGLVAIIISGYGNSRIVKYPEFFASQEVVLPENIGSSLLSSPSYVITYAYMTDFYGPNAARFDTSPYFQNLYTNGITNVFGINNGISP